MTDLQDKVVLITGGSRGIGRATVLAAAEAGGDVLIHYGTNETSAQETARLANGNCELVQGDLAKPGAAAAVWQRAMAWRGRIDVLVNNAGIFPGVSVDDPDDVWHLNWQQTLQVNLRATADLCRCAVNSWQSTDSEGHIVNVTSRAAARGDDPQHWAYAASKGGMEALTKTIARGYASQGIYAYNVAPGYVGTDMALDAFAQSPGMRERVEREIPIGEMAPPEEIANIICFLASGQARHATGTTIDINGASHVR